VATPTSSQCLCNGAAHGGHGFCDANGAFTPLGDANQCAHGALCATAHFCVKSDFDKAGSTTGTAAEGADGKSCDATTGTVIDTTAVCAATKTCDATAKQCLWTVDTTTHKKECTSGQICGTKGCEDSPDTSETPDADTSAIALSGLTGFLLTVVNVL